MGVRDSRRRWTFYRGGLTLRGLTSVGAVAKEVDLGVEQTDIVNALMNLP